MPETLTFSAVGFRFDVSAVNVAVAFCDIFSPYTSTVYSPAVMLGGIIVLRE